MKGPSIHVVEIRSPVDESKLPRAGARIGWRQPLDARALETIALWARARGGSSIRLHGAAVEQLEAVLETVPVAALDVDGARILRPPRRAAEVRALTLRGLPHRAKDVLASFEGLRTLRLDARGALVDVHVLGVLAGLRACSIEAAWLRDCGAIARLRELAGLELVHSAADDVDALLRHGGIVGLRLANVERVTSLEALRDRGSLRSLALESLLHLQSLAPIATLANLETLAIGALWQFNVGDAAFIAGMRGLRALSLDIGGARKNVEITKRLGLPPAPPFDVDDYGLTTSYESGVQSLPAYLSSVTTVGVAGGAADENGVV